MVYVDDMNMPFGRMIMSHMIADTKEELLEMVDKIGVQRKWIQKEDTAQEHFDISLAKKIKAIKLGAQPITYRLLGEITIDRAATGKTATELFELKKSDKEIDGYICYRG